MPNRDLIFKIITILLSVIIVPTFTWVWMTNSQLTALKVEFEQAQEDLEDMKSNSTDIKLIKNDIKHINSSLDDIKKLLKESFRPFPPQ